MIFRGTAPLNNSAFFFNRLELTGFIKEVRHNKHGSLTGLSLEDIVASVSELVEQKKKVRNLTTMTA